MENVFEVKDIPQECKNYKILSRGVENENQVTENVEKIESRLQPQNSNQKLSFDTVPKIQQAFYKVTYGKQSFLTHRPYNKTASSNLWHMTTPPGWETRHLDCYNCGYLHTRRVCPLVKCHICCTFGHSQHVCPVRRIRNKHQQNSNYVRFQG